MRNLITFTVCFVIMASVGFTCLMIGARYEKLISDWGLYKNVVGSDTKKGNSLDSLYRIINKQQEQLAKFDFIDKQADSTFIANWARFMIDCGMGHIADHFTNKYSFEEFCANSVSS